MKTLHILQEATPREAMGWTECWRHFISMPHQAMFTLGAVQAVLVMLWWLVDLGGRYGGLYASLTWAIPAPWGHLYLMIFALFPPYMFGFLMTTYPRWMSGVPVSPRHYLPAAALLAAGIVLAYAGLVIGKPWLLAAVGLYLAGWVVGLYALLHVYAGAQRPDTLHALITSGVLIIGFCLLLTYLFGIALDQTFLVGIARSGGVWWFLFPVFFAVSHRLIPFFSASAIPGYSVVRPNWTLWLMTAGGLSHGGLEIMQLPQWTWLVDLPMAATALWLSWQWSMRKTFAIRILAMLHLSFAWVGAALALFGAQSLALLLDAGFSLGRGPLHALMVGYFASMLIAMSTRVTLGHSGQPLTADNMAWAIFITVQIAALVRVVAEVGAIQPAAGHLYLCSAVLWLAAFSTWLIKFTPIYWTRN